MHNDEIKGQTQGDKYNVVDMYMFQQYVCVHACMHVYVCECVFPMIMFGKSSKMRRDI